MLDKLGFELESPQDEQKKQREKAREESHME